MDIKSALKILKIETFKNFEDIHFHYTNEITKATRSYTNAFSDSIKVTYSKRIDELNEAFDFISLNKDELKKRPSLEIPTINLKPKHKLIIIIMTVILIGFGTYYGIRSYKAKNLVEMGLKLFDSGINEQNNEFYERALVCFEKANNLGSVDGKYYFGKTLHRLYESERKRGFKEMQKAVIKGFDLIESGEEGRYNLLKEDSNNFYNNE